MTTNNLLGVAQQSVDQLDLGAPTTTGPLKGPLLVRALLEMKSLETVAVAGLRPAPVEWLPNPSGADHAAVPGMTPVRRTRIEQPDGSVLNVLRCSCATTGLRGHAVGGGR